VTDQRTVAGGGGGGGVWGRRRPRRARLALALSPLAGRAGAGAAAGTSSRWSAERAADRSSGADDDVIVTSRGTFTLDYFRRRSITRR